MSKLLVVATPIGNLMDLSPRMREALERADLIAAEDTRVTQKLLAHFDLKRPMVSCHRHNEGSRAEEIIGRMLEEDITVALTCDAGTPGISDPGSQLVAAAWRAGIPVEPISGPSAVVTALSVSGFDARTFAFYGFLPREKKAVWEALSRIQETGIPVAVLYESPHRVVELITRIEEQWPQCALCLCSDLTKRYERVYRGSPAQVLEELRQNPSAEKGEYCLVADLSAVPPPQKRAQAETETAAAHMLMHLLSGENLEGAAAKAAEAGYPRNEMYRARLEIKKMLERLAAESDE